MRHKGEEVIRLSSGWHRRKGVASPSMPIYLWCCGSSFGLVRICNTTFSMLVISNLKTKQVNPKIFFFFKKNLECLQLLKYKLSFTAPAQFIQKKTNWSCKKPWHPEQKEQRPSRTSKEQIVIIFFVLLCACVCCAVEP